MASSVNTVLSVKQSEAVRQEVTEPLRTSLVFGDRIQGMNRRTNCDGK